jgi:cell division protein ZapA (FtsZ GTPase activity inhibitor)
MMNDLEKLREAASLAVNLLHDLKAMTKQVHAARWTPEYRALAEKIHSGSRDLEAALWDGDRRLF